MSSLTIRKLDPGIKERLRVRAAEHGHSMEAEVRRIIETAVRPAAGSTVGETFERIHARFAAIGGVELELPPRDDLPREPPSFD